MVELQDTTENTWRRGDIYILALACTKPDGERCSELTGHNGFFYMVLSYENIVVLPYESEIDDHLFSGICSAGRRCDFIKVGTRDCHKPWFGNR